MQALSHQYSLGRMIGSVFREGIPMSLRLGGLSHLFRMGPPSKVICSRRMEQTLRASLLLTCHLQRWPDRIGQRRSILLSVESEQCSPMGIADDHPWIR